MTSPLATFLSAAGVAQNANAKPVAVSPENPLPVVVTGGGGSSNVAEFFNPLPALAANTTSPIGLDAQANLRSLMVGPVITGTDTRPNTIGGIQSYNVVAPSMNLIGDASHIYDPVSGFWVRNRGAAWGLNANLRSGYNAATPGAATTTMIAAPGAGLRLYITGIIVGSDASAHNTILTDSVTNYAFTSNIASSMQYMNFQTPIRLGVNLPAQVSISGAGACAVTMTGYVSD